MPSLDGAFVVSLVLISQLTVSHQQLCNGQKPTFVAIQSIAVNGTLRFFLPNQYYEMVDGFEINGPFDLPLGLSTPIKNNTKLLFVNSTCTYICDTDHCSVLNSDKNQVIRRVNFSAQNISIDGVTPFSTKEHIPSEDKLKTLLQQVLNRTTVTGQITPLGIAFTKQHVFNLVEYKNKLYLFDIDVVLNFAVEGIVTFSDHYYLYNQERHCRVQLFNQAKRGQLCPNQTVSERNMFDCRLLGLIEQDSSMESFPYTSTQYTHKKVIIISVMIVIVVIMVIVVGSLHFCGDDKDLYVHGIQRIKAKASASVLGYNKNSHTAFSN